MKTIDIKLESGKWLINDKPYQDLSWPEKAFFDEFLFAMRKETESREIQKLQSESLNTVVEEILNNK